MKPATRFLQWYLCVLSIFCGQWFCAESALASDDVYSFESARVYLDAQTRDLESFKDKFDGGQLQGLDEANAINIKYKAQPANYVLYRLNLAEKIKKNSGKQDKLTMHCREFLYIGNKEKENAAKFVAYNEALAEKFIPRDAYQVMDDDALRALLVRYLDANSAIYGFNNPDTILIRIENSIPYKNDEGDIGVSYSINLIDKKSDDASVQDKIFTVLYCNGEIVSFEPSINDPADAAVNKMCSSLQ